MLSRWPLAKTRGPHCNNLWSTLLLRTQTTQSSFRERYLHSAPSHLSSAHCSVCSSCRVQLFTRKPAILHDGVGVFGRSSKQIPGWYFEPQSPDQGVLCFRKVKLFSGTRLRVMYDRPHKKTYGLSCTDYHVIHIAQSHYFHIACTGFHPNRTIWKSRLEIHVPPYVKNVPTTVLTTLAPARHNFVRKFYTEFDENQTSGFAAHCPGLISVKTQILFYCYYFCVKFVFWLTPSSYNKLLNTGSKRHTSKLFCHRGMLSANTAYSWLPDKCTGLQHADHDEPARTSATQTGTCRRAVRSVCLST